MKQFFTIAFIAISFAGYSQGNPCNIADHSVGVIEDASTGNMTAIPDNLTIVIGESLEFYNYSSESTQGVAVVGDAGNPDLVGTVVYANLAVGECSAPVLFTVEGVYSFTIDNLNGNGNVDVLTVNVMGADTGTGGTAGCTLESATNFDPSAVVDDGSCTFDTGDPSVPAATLYTEAQLSQMLADSIAAAIAAYAAEFETASASLAIQVAEANDALAVEVDAHALTQANLDQTTSELADMTEAFAGASTTITSLQGYVSFWFGQWGVAMDEMAVASNTVDQLTADLNTALADLAFASSNTFANVSTCERLDLDGNGAYTTSDLVVGLGYFGMACE